MSRIRSHWLDIVIVLGALVAAVEAAIRTDTGAGGVSPWVAAPAAAAIVAPLLARQSRPFAGPIAVWVVAAAVSFVDAQLVINSAALFVTGMAASFLLGHLRDDLQARLGLAIGLVGSAIIVFNDADHTAAAYVFVPAQFAIVWAAGYALRERAARAEAAQASARVAIAEERARIARELHDVVAHAVSVMVLQVGAVRHRLPAEREEDVAALRRVEQAGRTALAEMRGLLGAMRRDGEEAELGPQPGLGDLDTLLHSVRRAGLPVELHVEGERAMLSPAIELSAYRIIQEGLTNALKHAGAGRADVLLRYGADDLQIEVFDDGRGPAGGGNPGHGLVGIRERVRMYGGDMSATSGADGGFLLRTRLPLTDYPS